MLHSPISHAPVAPQSVPDMDAIVQHLVTAAEAVEADPEYVVTALITAAVEISDGAIPPDEVATLLRTIADSVSPRRLV